MSIGSRIRQARERKKITQEELGELCGTTKQSIFKYENGVVTNIPFNKLERIAKVLDVSPAYLLEWTDSPLESEYGWYAPEKFWDKINQDRAGFLHYFLETVNTLSPLDIKKRWDIDCNNPDDSPEDKFKIFLKDAVESVRLSADDGEWWIKPKRILRGLNTYEEENASSGPGAGLSVSASEASLIKKYRDLDSHGKTMVSVVIAEEEKRMKEEKKRKRSKKYEEFDEAGESTGRVIPHYFSAPAAGYASPIFDEDFEYIEVGGDVPPQADFAVDIQGDSMEPYIMDGSTVYVNRDPLANADVGIFFFDGAMLCKQYYKDEWGNVNLLSMNRARADADVFIEEDSDLTLVCYGRVILPHRLRLAVPEEDLL